MRNKRYSDMCDVFSLRFNRMMDAKGVTMKQAATDLVIGYVSLCKWAEGEALPSCCLLAEMAKYFNCTTDYLLGLEE